MNNQVVTVNLVPGLSTPAVVRVSQYDYGRPITFNILDGTSTASIGSSATVTIEGTKPSGLGFSEAATLASGSTVTINTTYAMTQEAGMIPAELRIVQSGSGDIGTANFILAVEATPHAEGTTDGTQETMASLETRLQGQIDDLSDRIDDIEAGGSGLSQTEKNLILTLFSKAAYAEDDASTAYDALENLWTTTTRTIIYNLSHVSSSNTTASVESGQSYTTTLTATGSYTLNTVTVTMGGDDITSTAYSSGTVSIPSVTGNIVITATAIPSADRYTLYDYIYNSKASGDAGATDYVLTDLTYSPSFNTLNVEFEAMNSNDKDTANALFCTNNTSTSNTGNMVWYARASKGGFSAYNLGQAKQLNTVTADTRAIIKYYFVDGGQSYMQWENTTTNVTTMAKSSVSSNSIPLVLAGGYTFANGSLYGMIPNGKSKLGYVKFTDPSTNTLLYHFIPAYDTIEQKYGFYEQVNGIFYAATGTNLVCANWA